MAEMADPYSKYSKKRTPTPFITRNIKQKDGNYVATKLYLKPDHDNIDSPPVTYRGGVFGDFMACNNCDEMHNIQWCPYNYWYTKVDPFM